MHCPLIRGNNQVDHKFCSFLNEQLKSLDHILLRPIVFGNSAYAFPEEWDL